MENDKIVIRLEAPKEGLTSSGGDSLKKDGVGRKYRGRVVNFKPYGFFVETSDGKFGLVHGKNIKGWNWSRRFDQTFAFGSEIEVTVVDIEEETNRMSFACEMPAQEQHETPPPVSRKEAAQSWADENEERSRQAYDWLKNELTDGPLYGPLTTLLCDRFGVPVPASRWIRLFPDFICYSGQGDNPSELPAVALADRANDAAYWDRLKVRTDELTENRGRKTDDTAPLAELMRRLNDGCPFPGSRWIARYRAAAARIAAGGQGGFGACDIVERLVVPLLGELGWDVSDENEAFVRGDGLSFSVCLPGLVVLASPAGTDFNALRGERNAVEKMLGLYNRLPAGTMTKVVWTNGTDWIVFTGELLAGCIGILADHRGEAIMDERARGEGGRFFREISFPSEGRVSAWLTAFGDLSEELRN